MKPFDSDLGASLRALLNGRVCIVGVGNRERGDDGAGPHLIDVRRAGTPGFWLDAGVVPENFLEPIARTRPDNVLIVDAVAFGGFPGECRLLDAKAVDTLTLSTHAGSLRTLSDYLAIRTDAPVKVLAIQPHSIAPGKGLSRPVEESVQNLAEMLSGILGSTELPNCPDNE